MKSDKISGGILLAVFAAGVAMAMKFPTRSSYFPLIVCAAGALLSGILLIRAFGKNNKESIEPLTPKARKMIVIMSVLIILYALGINFIGFAVSTFVFIVVSGFVLCPEKISKENKKPAIIILGTALVVSVLITVVFKTVLYVPLPSGILI